jgi:hypothetical protein
LVRHDLEYIVETAVALLGQTPIPLYPFGHQIEHLRFQMDGPALCLPGTADQAGILQDPEVLGDRLDRHLVGLGQFQDRGIANG